MKGDSFRFGKIFSKMVGKRRRQSTIPMVKQEANAILEEFLKRHQESLTSITPMNSVYQKVSELEVFEEKPNFKRRASYRKASQESILSDDSFHSMTKTEITYENTAPLASDEECSSSIESPSSAPGFLCNSSKLRHSSSNSSSSSSDNDSRVRRKKSLFKRAKERLRMSFNISRKFKKIQAEKEANNDNVFIKKKDKKTKKKVKTKDKVLKEVTTYTRTHIRQSSTISDIPCQKTEITLREGEIWESKKIKEKNGESRHIESHLSIKESSDNSSSKGLPSSLNKLKSLHRNGKKTLSLGRKESTEQKDIIQNIHRRTASEGNDKAIHVIKEESKDNKDSTTTNVLNEIIALENETGNDYPLIETSAPRKNLHLNINPVFTSDLPDRGNFEFKAEHVEKVTTVCTPDGLTQRRSSVEHYEHLSDCDNTEVNNDRELDEIDGAVGGVMSSEPSDEQSKTDMFKRVADKLMTLADTQTSASDSEGACARPRPIDGIQSPELSDLEKELVEYILSIKTSSQFPSEAVIDILKQLTYQNFKETFEAYSKDKSGLQEVAALFFLSKAAINLVGPFRAMASQIKELTLRYFEDKCAAFIVEKGGWDSVLEDTDEEPKGE
ncbi:uncharacterized protein LOC106873535 isoform X2 [Octopus bimaculoides]|uniref:uncharacterized protein LOC106873535 isoform X2 n=1 Tax=Octopus bimaculoides TaxID=37653 RepID=UPI00071DCC6D|nr:uncharacterized protein LOC106873535 isoform X2 [Octopus bimaculoides]|eukprot:XP_014776413.1 PREDICTED: uncharacterized protein LOC106873535 isoform X2 [Octopus bimaculoides]